MPSRRDSASARCPSSIRTDSASRSSSRRVRRGRSFSPWDHSTVEPDHQVRGLYSAQIWERGLAPTTTFLTSVLGFKKIAEENGWTRFGFDNATGVLDIRETPEERRGAWGVGQRAPPRLARRRRDASARRARAGRNGRTSGDAGHRSLLVQVGVFPGAWRRALRAGDRRPRLRRGRRSRAPRRDARAAAMARALAPPSIEAALPPLKPAA